MENIQQLVIDIMQRYNVPNSKELQARQPLTIEEVMSRIEANGYHIQGQS